MTPSDSTYQHEFSKIHEAAMYDAARRRQKARKTLSVIKDFLTARNISTNRLTLLDIGCSTGFMTNLYRESFGSVIGIDIDQSAISYAKAHFSCENAEFLVRDSMETGFQDDTFDVVTCTQIYEHVPDCKRLITEIRRILKPGGICYFAAGNRLQWMEPHYRLPLLSVFPKSIAHHYLRLTRRGSHYYETHLSYWGLKRLVADFETFDYTLQVIRNPQRFSATEMIKDRSLKQRIALGLLQIAYWASPAYIWILRKPA